MCNFPSQRCEFLFTITHTFLLCAMLQVLVKTNTHSHLVTKSNIITTTTNNNNNNRIYKCLTYLSDLCNAIARKTKGQLWSEHRDGIGIRKNSTTLG